MLDCSKINLKKGSKGNDVKKVQEYLKYMGLYKREIDGDYGEYTISAVKKLQGKYNLKEDGNFGLFTCRKCGINGQDISNSNQTIEKEVFKDIITRHDKYVKENGKEPQICYINIENKYRYITIKKYTDMKQRWDKWIQNHGGKEPNYCYVNIPSERGESTGSKSDADSEYIKAFEDAVGRKISNFKDGYNAIKYRKYIGYNNDVYSRSVALQRLKQKRGLNCSDISQLLYRLAQAYGHNVHYVHIMCRSGIGHIILSVDGTWVDGASALSSGKAYGTGWCFNGRVINRDDGWLMTDDGRT